MTIAAVRRPGIRTVDLKVPQRESVERGSTSSVRTTVENVIEDIRQRGDVAVREYSEKFDNYSADSYLLSSEQLDEIVARVPRQVIEDITFVQEQVRVMAQKQLESLTDFEIETLPGVFLGQKNVPIQAAGATFPAASTRCWPVRT